MMCSINADCLSGYYCDGGGACQLEKANSAVWLTLFHQLEDLHRLPFNKISPRPASSKAAAGDSAKANMVAQRS